MKKSVLTIMLLSAVSFAQLQYAGNPYFKVDQFGYHPAEEKVMVISRLRKDLMPILKALSYRVKTSRLEPGRMETWEMKQSILVLRVSGMKEKPTS